MPDRTQCPGCGCDVEDCCCDDVLDDEERNCHWCSGEGWTECHDPIECTSPHNRLGECQCLSCGGSGLAKDMTVW